MLRRTSFLCETMPRILLGPTTSQWLVATSDFGNIFTAIFQTKENTKVVGPTLPHVSSCDERTRREKDKNFNVQSAHFFFSSTFHSNHNLIQGSVFM